MIFMNTVNSTTDYYDAFISYRHQTGFYMAQVIYDKLVYNGYSVFMDKTMSSGKFEDQICDAIKKSKNFIVVLFPGDFKSSNCTWLRKEALTALNTPDINIIPVICDKFKLPLFPQPWMRTLLSHNGIDMHKDYSLDQDLDKLCDRFMKNANPVKPLITTVDFFNKNLQASNSSLKPLSVDMAFHAGAAWLRPGPEHEILLNKLLKMDITKRVLVNSASSAESIAKHMRAKQPAVYTSFEEAIANWTQLAADNSNLLEVRVCDIPLIHVYHAIHYKNGDKGHYGRVHVKYYAYNNTNLNKAFEHELSSFSNYYDIYNNEFEYLWELSKKV